MSERLALHMDRDRESAWKLPDMVESHLTSTNQTVYKKNRMNGASRRGRAFLRYGIHLLLPWDVARV